MLLPSELNDTGQVVMQACIIQKAACFGSSSTEAVRLVRLTYASL